MVTRTGKGSVLTIKGTIEMDAIVMEGKTLKAGTIIPENSLVFYKKISFIFLTKCLLFKGAVAGIHNVANPVSVARLVMENTPHVFLAGQGANDFAREKGVPFIPDDELITDFARQALDDFIHGKGEATSEVG